MNQLYWNEVRKQRGCERLGITSGQWSYIKRIGTILERLYTNSCNGFYNEYTGKENERQARYNEMLEGQYEARAEKFAKDNGLQLYLQTDPRGACIYLDTNPIADNDYTKAVCIF